MDFGIYKATIVKLKKKKKKHKKKRSKTNLSDKKLPRRLSFG